MKTPGDPHRPSPRDQLAAAYDRCAGALFRYAAFLLADRSLAEDALQQAFTALAGMGDRIAALDSLDGYLRTSVRHECYRLLAARKPAATLRADWPAFLEPVEAALACGEQQRQIESALRTLPPEQREIIHLKVYEAMTFQQIADILKIPLNTAASRYRYAAEKLRESLAALVAN